MSEMFYCGILKLFLKMRIEHFTPRLDFYYCYMLYIENYVSSCFIFQLSANTDQETYSLEIKHTLATDAGRYQVTATNSEGSAKCSVSLNVNALDKADVDDFRTLLKSRYVLRTDLYDMKKHVYSMYADFIK